MKEVIIRGLVLSVFLMMFFLVSRLWGEEIVMGLLK